MAARLPTFAAIEPLMQAGAPSGLVSRHHSIGQCAAHKVEKVLVHKLAPAELPTDSLTRYAHQMRMAATKRLRLPPPLPMFSPTELITSELPT